MAHHKAVAKASKGAKRGRPPTGTRAAEENGVEKANSPTPKVASAITKPKGKRGRPAGSTKKNKKRGAAAKTVKNTTQKEKEGERGVSGTEGGQQCARSFSGGCQEGGQP